MLLAAATGSKPAESKDLAQDFQEVEPATDKDLIFLEAVLATDNKVTLEPPTRVETLELIRVELQEPTKAALLAPKALQAPPPVSGPPLGQPTGSPPANTQGMEPQMFLHLPRAEAARAAPHSPTPGTNPNNE